MKKYLSFLPALIWMAVIFTFSAFPARQSTEQSVTVTGVIIGTICHFTGQSALMQQELTAFWEPVVRKLAHMSEYALLMFLWLRPLSRTVLRIRKGMAAAILICLLFASSDEFHQTFVAGRAGRATDVLIDMSGALICAAFYALAVHRAK